MNEGKHMNRILKPSIAILIVLAVVFDCGMLNAYATEPVADEYEHEVNLLVAEEDAEEKTTEKVQVEVPDGMSCPDEAAEPESEEITEETEADLLESESDFANETYGDQEVTYKYYRPYDTAEYELKYHVTDEINKHICIDGYRALFPPEGELVIPETITTITEPDLSQTIYRVTMIGAGAFRGCYGFTGDLTIPDSVTTIGNEAFAYCSGFTGKLTIPDSVTTIGNEAFTYCYGFTGKLTIPDSVTMISDGAFSDCRNFNKLTIPDSVTAIGKEAFYACSCFTGDLTIPDSVTTIGIEAFAYCSCFTGNLIIPDSVTTIGANAFHDCDGFTGFLLLPETVDSIGRGAFSGTTGFRKIINFDSVPIELPVSDGKIWKNVITGETITEIAKGMAVRSDYVGSGTFIITPIADQTYSGTMICPPVQVLYDGIRLTEKKDYTVKYSNNTNTGNAALVTVTGIGNYEGKGTETFRIVEKDITADGVTASEIPSVAYKKNKSYTPVPTITYGKKKLANKKDFTILYYTKDNVETIPTDPGEYYARITGINNFTGRRELHFEIANEEQVPVSKLTIEKIPDEKYRNGVQIRPEPVVKDGKDDLIKDIHYTVSYGTNKEAGIGTIKITGIDKYVGTRTVTFKITAQIPMNKVRINDFDTAPEYNGSKQNQTAMSLSYIEKAGDIPEVIRYALDETYMNMTDEEKNEIDCIVSFKNNTNAGTATMILTGAHRCSGTVTKTFKIIPFDIKNAPTEQFRVDLDKSVYPYAKSGVKPKPTVSFKVGSTWRELKEKKDYTLSFANNKALHSGAGENTPIVKVTGKGNFKGTNQNTTFAIEQADMTASGIKVVAGDIVYSNKEGNWKPKKITVTDADGKTLTAVKDYDPNTIEYSNELGEILNGTETLPAGSTIHVSVKAAESSRVYSGTAEGTYRIAKADIGKLTATVAAKPYTGNAVTLTNADITWRLGGKKVDGVDFVIGNYQNNTNKGKATVTVRGAGENYCGSKTIAFTIRAKGFLWWWDLLN